MNPIRKFFYPKSICIAGASTKEKSIGYEILNTIKSYGFGGLVFPVNPKADEILGYKCYKAIEEIDEEVDLAIIVVPKQFAEQTIDSLLLKKVEALILITAGFKEIGKEGEELERRILTKIQNAGARMVGPNCMGVINTLEPVKLNATFVAEKPETGKTGFLSQSGALGAAVLNSLRETEIRFAHFISVGNKADINENHILHFWQNDPNIQTLTFYLESFINGKEFVTPFFSGEITKPAIVLKAGKTESGMKAASSHTGALSGKDKVADAVMKQFGIIRAANLNDLFNTAKGFENFPIPQGNRIAVITNAGGPAILTVDSLESRGLTLANFSEETKRNLRSIVHPEGSVENPVDLLPGATAETYHNVVEMALQDKNVEAVISIFVQPVMVEPMGVVESVASLKASKPIMLVVMPQPEFWSQYRASSKWRLPLFRNPEEPAVVLSNMLFYSQCQKRIGKNKASYIELLNLPRAENNFNAGFLGQHQVEQLCKKYSIPITKQIFCLPAEIEKVDGIGFPVVLKGLGKDVIHKSEIDAVKLNIKSKEELIKSAAEISAGFNNKSLRIDEFLIQPFITGKHELLLGGFRDPSFGPVILFGSGGKYVEVLDDTAIKSCYLSADDIDDMIKSTKIGKILAGVRGEKPHSLPALKNLIAACSRMMIENPNIAEFDLNPVIATADNKFVAVDVRFRIGEP